MSGDGWDELLAEAQQRLDEQEDDPNAALGDDMTPSPEEHFMGRWRGVGTMQTKERGTIGVFLVWDRDGKPGFVYQHGRLVAEVEELQPQPGDEVLVLRGPTKWFQKDGEERKSYPYVLRKRECADPLPDEPAAVTAKAAGGQLGADEDLPF